MSHIDGYLHRAVRCPSSRQEGGVLRNNFDQLGDLDYGPPFCPSSFHTDRTALEPAQATGDAAALVNATGAAFQTVIWLAAICMREHIQNGCERAVSQPAMDGLWNAARCHTTTELLSKYAAASP